MDTEPASDRPYPLLQRFVRWVLPGCLALVGAIVAASGMASLGIVEATYLELAARRAGQISVEMTEAAPAPWRRALAGGTLAPADLDALNGAFAGIRSRFGLTGLKVYAASGLTLYSSEAGEVGKVETGAALARVAASGEGTAIAKTEADGSVVYELYVPYQDKDSATAAAVFELYEPLGQLRSILWRTLAWSASIPAAMLGLLMGLLYLLVRRAQASIDGRTATIVALRQRIEQLVSRHAVAAVREQEGAADPAPRLVEVAILYSDVRGFTGFSEGRDPAAVVAEIDRLMGLEADCVEAEGGDVDKIIGDALLARFDGPDRQRRAVAAAQAIQQRLAGAGLPLAVGIGLFAGEVIAGTVGSRRRRDYSLFGDAVNVASRLCGLAEAGEVVAEAGTLAEAGGPAGFGPVETLAVKGRRQPVQARRWRP